MNVTEDFKGLVPYVPGKPIEETRREFGLSQVHKLASNENPLGPSPKALKAMRETLSELHLYPDASAHELRLTMARHLDVPGDWLFFGNGSDEAVDLLIRTFGKPGDAILTSVCAFGSYKISAHAARMTCTETPLCSDLRFDLEAMRYAFIPMKHKVVFITNPNNPTGTYATRLELEKFLEFFGGREDVVVVIDEAYFEFTRALDYPNGLDYVRRFKNVAILRTMSKIYGLAGLRLGTLIAQPEITQVMNLVRKPFNVNSLIQAAAVAALGDFEHVRKTRELTWQGLDYFYEELGKMGLNFIKSQGNFVLVDIARDALPIYDQCLKKGIIFRPVKNYGLNTHLRISVGLEGENRLAMQVLKDALSSVPPGGLTGA